LELLILLDSLLQENNNQQCYRRVWLQISDVTRDDEL